MTRLITALALLASLSGCTVDPDTGFSPLGKFVSGVADAMYDQYDGGPVTTTCSAGKGGSYSCTTF